MFRLRKPVKLENKCMKGNGQKIVCQEMEPTITLMGLSIEGSGKIISIADREPMNSQTAPFTKDNGEHTL